MRMEIELTNEDARMLEEYANTELVVAMSVCDTLTKGETRCFNKGILTGFALMIDMLEKDRRLSVVGLADRMLMAYRMIEEEEA